MAFFGWRNNMKILMTCDYWYTSAYRVMRALEILGHTVDVISIMDKTPGQTCPKEPPKMIDHDLCIMFVETYQLALTVLEHPIRKIAYVCDLASVREGDDEWNYVEEQVFNACEGILVSSKGWMPYLEKYDKPIETLYPWVPEDIFPKEVEKDREWAYCGGLSNKGQRNLIPYMDKDFGYFAKKDHHIDAKYMGFLPQKEMLQELAHYKHALAGFAEPNKFNEAAVQMKIFDYMAAGCDIKCIGGKNTQEFLDNNPRNSKLTVEKVANINRIIL